MPIYTNDEFRQKHQADQLDTILITCWMIEIQADAYVVSFEPVNCTINSKVPVSIVDRVEPLGRRLCRDNNGVWQELPRVRLYLQKPDSPDGKVLFEILHDRGMSKESCGCEEPRPSLDVADDGPFDALKNLVGTVLGVEIQCNVMSGKNDCNSTERCRRAFRFLKEFRDDPSRDTVQGLSDYVNGSGRNKRCMRRIFEVADADFTKLVVLIGEILG